MAPSIAKDVLLGRLLSVEAAGDGSIGQAWTSEISSRVDEVVGGTVQKVPGEQVFAGNGGLGARRAFDKSEGTSRKPVPVPVKGQVPVYLIV